jgi:hypothetical protein
MGQIGNAVGGALGSMGGQPQNPMGGGSFVQTGQFGSQPIDMGGFGGNMGGSQMMTGMGGNAQNGYMSPGGFGNNSQLGQLGNMANAAGVSTDFSMMQGGPNVGGGFGGDMGNQFGQLGNMANIPQSEIGMPGGQGGQTQGGMGQQAAQQQAMQQAMQRQYAQPGQDYRTVPPQQMDQMRGLGQQMDAYMQTSPAMKQMQDLQAKIQGGQITPQAGMAQAEALNAQLRDYQQNAPMMPQIKALQQAQAMQQQGGMGQQPRGLASLLGGMPNQPVPTARPVSTTQPAPMAQPAPVAARPAPMAQPAPVPTRAAPAKPSIMGSRPAAKPVAKPSVVPPKTPPAVASAIQKLAAKKQIKR